MLGLRVILLSFGLLCANSIMSFAQASKTQGDSLIRVREADLIEVLSKLQKPDSTAVSMETLRYQLLLNLLASPQATAVVGNAPQVSTSYDARLQRIERQIRTPQQTAIPNSINIITGQEQPAVVAQPSLQPSAPKVEALPLGQSNLQATHEIDTVYLREDIPMVELRESLPVQTSDAFSTSVYFSVGSATLSVASRELLREVAKELKTAPTTTITLGAYASPDGSKAQNERLAQKRYVAVMQELMRYGVEANRLNTNPNVGIDYNKRMPDLARRVDIIVR